MKSRSNEIMVSVLSNVYEMLNTCDIMPKLYILDIEWSKAIKTSFKAKKQQFYSLNPTSIDSMWQKLLLKQQNTILLRPSSQLHQISHYNSGAQFSTSGNKLQDFNPLTKNHQ